MCLANRESEDLRQVAIVGLTSRFTNEPVTRFRIKKGSVRRVTTAANANAVPRRRRNAWIGRYLRALHRLGAFGGRGNTLCSRRRGSSTAARTAAVVVTVDTGDKCFNSGCDRKGGFNFAYAAAIEDPLRQPETSASCRIEISSERSDVEQVFRRHGCHPKRRCSRFAFRKLDYDGRADRLPTILGGSMHPSVVLPPGRHKGSKGTGARRDIIRRGQELPDDLEHSESACNRTVCLARISSAMLVWFRMPLRELRSAATALA